MQAVQGYVAVGALACQMNSFLKERLSTVLFCEPKAVAASGKPTPSTAAAPASPLYEVLLDDSVLFPEGGGQPCDLGTIGEARVVEVTRRGDKCVVVTDQPLTVGASYNVAVDWARRVDHMQHHSAQHLLTAIVEKQLQLPTMCWSLTHPYCFIQVPAASITEEQVQAVEDECNSLIASGTLVQRQVFATRDDVPPARSRGIPADVTGPIRLIEIPDVDTCTCCGTHVETLQQLQMLKLLHQEPKGNTCRLFFITGDRLRRSYSELYQLQKGLVKEMGTNVSNLLPSVVRRGQDLAAETKHNKKLLAELSKLIATETATRAAVHFDQQITKRQEAGASATSAAVVPFLFYREDVDIDFIGEVADACLAAIPTQTVSNTADAAPLLLTAMFGCGVGTDGQFILVGNAPKEQLTPQFEKLCALVEGKGGYSKNKFRGKGNMKKWKEVTKCTTW